MSGLTRIRKAIRERRVAFSDHALEEMDDDALTLSDIYDVLSHGRIRRTEVHDPRGSRYVVGDILGNGESVEAVCRFLASGVLLVITVYVVKEANDE